MKKILLYSLLLPGSYIISSNDSLTTLNTIQTTINQWEIFQQQQELEYQRQEIEKLKQEAARREIITAIKHQQSEINLKAQLGFYDTNPMALGADIQKLMIPLRKLLFNRVNLINNKIGENPAGAAIIFGALSGACGIWSFMARDKAPLIGTGAFGIFAALCASDIGNYNQRKIEILALHRTIAQKIDQEFILLINRQNISHISYALYKYLIEFLINHEELTPHCQNVRVELINQLTLDLESIL